MDAEKGFGPQQDDDTVELPHEQIQKLGKDPDGDPGEIKDGSWWVMPEALGEILRLGAVFIVGVLGGGIAGFILGRRANRPAVGSQWRRTMRQSTGRKYTGRQWRRRGRTRL